MKVLIAALATCTALSAAGQMRIFNENQNDNELLEPFLFNKREEMAQKTPLGISGDVRVSFRIDHTRDAPEAKKVIDDRVYSYKAEANIYLDETRGCWWTSMKISAANNLSVANGTYDELKLKRALIGYKPYCCGKDEIYGEVGRQFLSDKFDSEVMFASPLDGGFFHATMTRPEMGRLFLQGAFLVVNSQKGQYGWVASAGWENIRSTGFFVKYAIIDWGTERLLEVIENRETKEKVLATVRPSYLTSQILIGYKWCWGPKEMKVFGAYLRNHDARRFPLRREYIQFGREPNGFYLGIEVGKVRKCGDWAIKAEFDYVEAFCYPEFDNSGIGNSLGSNNGLYTVKKVGDDDFIILSDVRSPLNYWGPKVEFAYAFTDNVSGRIQYMRSWGIRKVFDRRRTFERVEAKLIYSF